MLPVRCHSVTVTASSSSRVVVAVFVLVIAFLVSVADCINTQSSAAAVVNRSLDLPTSTAADSQTAPISPLPTTNMVPTNGADHVKEPPSAPTSPAAVVGSTIGCVVTPLDSFQHAIIDDLLAEQQLNLIQYVLLFPNSSVNPLKVNLTRVFKVRSTTSVVLKRLCNQFITCMYNN